MLQAIGQLQTVEVMQQEALLWSHVAGVRKGDQDLECH